MSHPDRLVPLAVDAFLPHAKALRHDLHRHPELLFDLPRTAGVVRGELDRLGIPWRACAGHGTVAWLARGRAGVQRALRCDLDALPLTESTGAAWSSTIPGRMHACGHDGHTATLLAAAAFLKANELALPSQVTLIFQPAEEGGHGAREMIADGRLEGIDEVYGWHNWPPIPFGRAACPVGPVMGANAEWYATIHGRGGHAAQPERCIDPIAVGAAFTTLVQQVVSRQTAPQQALVVGVSCFHAGTYDNIIPDTAELVGTVRAATTALRDAAAVRVQAVLQACCAAAGAHADFRVEPCYGATVNHPLAQARAAAALDAIMPAGWSWTENIPLLAAEDFGYYAEQRPACYVLLGAGRPGDTIEPCHSCRFDFNDDLIPVGLRWFAHVVGLPNV